MEGLTSFPRETSRKSGSVRSLRVWPVGAVSKIMRLKCENSGSLRN